MILIAMKDSLRPIGALAEHSWYIPMFLLQMASRRQEAQVWNARGA